MADGVISKIQLPDSTIYDVVDNTSGYMTGMTILSYGSSTWQNFIDAYSSNKVVYCRASSNSNPASGSQTRLAFMAYVNNATTPTEVEFQYYRSVSTHTASQQGDQVYVYKLNKTNGWSVTVREASVKVVAGTGLGGTYSNGTMTLTGPTKVSDLTNDSGFLTSSSTLDASKLSGAIPSAVTATTQSASDNSTKIATTAYVTTAIANLPEPMLFKGSVGTGGTITSLPTATAANEGFTYKVITDLSSPVTAKVGDTVISNGSEWVVIPSGDEPSGTVTSISAGTGLTTDQTNNAAITSSGTIKVKLNSETAITDISKVYNVGVNSNGELCVKVSWSDIQTRTSDSGTERTIYLAGGTTSGDETDGLSKHESIKALVSSNTETDGYTILALGNRTSVGSAGAKYGCIRLYGKYNTFIDIRPQSLTNTGTIYLPFSGGTLVREEDLIPVAQQSSTLNVALVSSSSKSKFYDSHGGLTYSSSYFNDGSLGYSWLTLGNNIATGTESNARGHIRLYGNSTYYTDIDAPNSTATRTITLPDKTGTVALTSDIPTISYPVTSVNSKTGAVTLTASDVGALPSNTTGDDIAYDENTSVNAKIDTIISSGGEPNAINTISVNNVNQTITNKNVNIETVIIGSTSDYTPTQVKSAIDSGKNVIITYTHSTYGNIVGYSFNYSQAYNALVSNTIAYYNNNYYLFEIVGTLTNNNWSCEVTQIAQSSDIPTVPTNISAFTNDSGFTTKNMWYGTCSTGASTAAKAVTTSSGDFTLTTGSMVRVKFTNSNSYDGTATLNVDGKGAKNITKVGANTTTQYYWVSGEVVDFVYDGTNFVMSGKGTASVTYYGLTKLSSATDSTSVTLAATPKAVKTAYDLANSKQAELVSGTNIKTINNTSLLGSGDISVAADGTPIPTASEVAEFDTNAHMNSTDMTTGSGGEVEQFIDELDISGINAVDYVVEQGTSGVWKYRKWNSGYVEAWAVVSNSSMSWATYITGLYYSSPQWTVNYPFTIYDASISAIVTYCNGNVGWVTNVTKASNSQAKVTIVRNGNSGQVIMDFFVRGRWK